jgi:hypothetical protein
MKAFSVARAFSAGIDLIERKPLTLVWWAAAIMVLELAPRYLLPQLLGASSGASPPIGQFSHDTQTNPVSILQQMQQSPASGRSPFEALGSLLWTCFYSAILVNAAYRAVLEPQKSAFGYLRLGAAEFWQFLVLLTIVCLAVIYVVAAIYLTAFMALVRSALAEPWGAWLMLAYVIALVVLTYWILLRLSLGPVMTFAERRYRLFHSWRVTKASVWRLFWTGFLTAALLWGLILALLKSLGIVLIPVGTFWGGLTQLAPVLASLEPTTWALSVGLILLLVAIALVEALIRAVTLPPWAAAYRELFADRS